MRIWLDADSCPLIVRNYVLKIAIKFQLEVIFAANRYISADIDNYKMIICNINEKDSADSYILEHAERGDLVITKDILLAEKLMQKKIEVINDRGINFNSINIKDRLVEREFDLQLAKIGIGLKKNNTYNRNKKQFTKFVNCFDRVVSKLLT